MVKVNPKLNATIRTIKGKKVKQLRNEGLLPATVYGKGFEPMSVQVAEKELLAIYDHVGESGLVDLLVDEKTYPILFRNPQYHPLWGNLLHVDCYKVNLKEKITTTVPLEFVGEAPATKEGLILVEVSNEIEVEALPTDLPEKIEVDLSVLTGLESMVTVADLKIDSAKVEIKTAPDQVIAKVEEPKAEEEPVAEAVAPTEVPATQQKSPEELAEAEKEKKE